MNIFLKEHQKLLEKLIRAEVQFIIVGGYAVNFHGYNRTTGDMDLWINPDNKNKEALLDVLLEMGFKKEGIELLQKADFKLPFVFNIWKRPYKVDFLTQISGLSFEEAYQERIVEEHRGLSIPILGFRHLVLSKMATNRLRDKADIEELQKIMQIKGKRK